MGRRVFITATDTGAGKSYLTDLLIRKLLAEDSPARAIKPVAAGYGKGGLNEDVALLMQAQDIDNPTAINLYSFALAASPNLAAAAESTAIDPGKLVEWCRAQGEGEELLLIEGVGGLMVPLTDHFLVSDWIDAMPECEVILVVGTRLGCINHTLLSLNKLTQMGRLPAVIVLNDLGDPGAVEQAEKALLPHIDARTRLICLSRHAGLNHNRLKDILA